MGSRWLLGSLEDSGKKKKKAARSSCAGLSFSSEPISPPGGGLREVHFSSALLKCVDFYDQNSACRIRRVIFII